MKILSLRLKNNFLGWDFDEVDFSSNLTLLVGVSGAGKTQILQGIIDLKRVANGKSINGFEWKIKFLTVNNTEFIWEGCFNVIDTDDIYFDDDEKEKPSLLYEKLTSNGQVFIDRSEEEIKYKDNLIPKLSSHQSMIYLLKEENDITEVFNALNKIEYNDQTKNRSVFISTRTSLNLLKKKYTTLESIINSFAKFSRIYTVLLQNKV